MNFTRAIVRQPADTMVKGLTTANLGKPDHQKALAQHEAYVNALKSLGLEVMILPPDDRFPDSVFVEDTAVVTPDFGIVTMPGAPTRRDEVVEMERVLNRFFLSAEKIRFPGTVDGGDVMQADNIFYIGISGRTNEDGAKQLQKLLENRGFEVFPLTVKNGLHLKSDVAYLGEKTLLITDALADEELFSGYKKIIVPPEESYAANAVMINGTVLMAEGYNRTIDLVKKEGFRVKTLDVSEFRKLDGGLSCLSLRF